MNNELETQALNTLSRMLLGPDPLAVQRSSVPQADGDSRPIDDEFLTDRDPGDEND